MNEEIFIDRGLTLNEIKLLLQSPMPDRERAYLRGLYDTFFRPNELLMCNIEDYNKTTGEIIARYTKNKYNPRLKKYLKSPPKHMLLSQPTQILFRKIISNRKRGPIFINKRGNRISVTHFQVFINKLATSVGIQKLCKITPSGKHYHLVCLKALREAGERHCDLRGMDSDISAKAAQHSAIVKEKYYKKAGWEEIQQQIKKFHPSFEEEGI